MKTDTRQIHFDPDLEIEAFFFHGVMQPFPAHFHDYTVIGCIEDGFRELICSNRVYRSEPGDILVFNPGDSHACTALHGKALTYRCLNIDTSVLRRAMKPYSGGEHDPKCPEAVIKDSGLYTALRRLHTAIMDSESLTARQRLFHAFFRLFARHCTSFASHEGVFKPTQAVLTARNWMEQHYAERITLEDLSKLTGMNRFALVRSFVRETGSTPYRYLETIRIGIAQKLLEQGMEPSMVAIETGFADQSHFGRFFKQRIGLTPARYRAVFRDPAA